MDILHDHTDFLPQIPFLVLGACCRLFDPKSIYFLDLYKISDPLVGCMTYLIFEPPIAQPGDPADTNFFLS
jgi:hypothetical protein